MQKEILNMNKVQHYTNIRTSRVQYNGVCINGATMTTDQGVSFEFGTYESSNIYALLSCPWILVFWWMRNTIHDWNEFHRTSVVRLSTITVPLFIRVGLWC